MKCLTDSSVFPAVLLGPDHVSSTLHYHGPPLPKEDVSEIREAGRMKPSEHGCEGSPKRNVITSAWQKSKSFKTEEESTSLNQLFKDIHRQTF